jgi:hypothetical protein
MDWQIVLKQRSLPYLSWMPDALGVKHDYVALVDQNGKSVKEFHGGPSNGSTLASYLWTEEGNMLSAGESDPKEGYPRDGNPVAFSDGSDAVPVAHGTEEEMKARWAKGEAVVADEIARKKFLYQAAGDDAMNGNMVATTFLKGAGIAHPEDFHPASSIGFGHDLRDEPSNNPDVNPNAKAPNPSSPSVRPDRRSSTDSPDDLKTTALLRKPRSEWTAADLAHVEASNAAANKDHPEHDEAVHAMRDYRLRRQTRMRTGDGTVHVSAYERNRGGRAVHVGDYVRNLPLRS